MRLDEVFVLVEYDENKTWEVFGAKLLAAAKQDYSINLQLRKGDEEKLRSYVLHCLKQADPSKNQQYSQWLAKAYSVGGIRMEDLMSNVKDSLELFGKLKQKKKLEASDADIGRFKTVGDFEAMMSKYENVDLESGKDKQKNAVYNADVVFDDEEIRILKPKDVEAAMYYGRGTKWCTAAKNNNMYKAYASSGDLYIVIPKNPDYQGEKYQFHFEERQFMDEQDVPVALETMLDRYPSVRTALQKFSKGHIQFEPDAVKRKDSIAKSAKSLVSFGKDFGGVLVLQTKGLENEEFKDQAQQLIKDLDIFGINFGAPEAFESASALVLDVTNKAGVQIDDYGNYSKEVGMYDLRTYATLDAEAAVALFSPEHQETAAKIINSLANCTSKASLYMTIERMTKQPAYVPEMADNRDDEYDRRFYEH